MNEGTTSTGGRLPGHTVIALMKEQYSALKGVSEALSKIDKTLKDELREKQSQLDTLTAQIEAEGLNLDEFKGEISNPGIDKDLDNLFSNSQLKNDIFEASLNQLCN